MLDEKKYALAFNCLTNFTYQLYQRVLSKFGSLQQAFYGSSLELSDIIKNNDSLELFIQGRKNFSCDEFLLQLEKEKIEACFIEEDDYPSYLRNIYNPPPIFYYRGDLNIDWENSLSVVGSRSYSFYGEKIINEFIPILSQIGLTIVSGLALGIDSLAHQKTLDFFGKTVAVLGSGLDKLSIYPYSNRFLLEDIVEKGGLVISEFPPGTKPLSYHFPQRNRIIAGLTPVTLVVEAGFKSGSLITAMSALEEGREVLSVPGDIFKENLEGNNKLLQKGAYLVLSVVDILPYFGLDGESGDNVAKQALKSQYEPQNEIERLIIKELRQGSLHIDDLLAKIGDNISQINSALVLLELNAVIRDLGAKNYELV